MRVPRRRKQPETPFVTQAELCRRMSQEATAIERDGNRLASAQMALLTWLRHQVTALEAVRVDVETLESVIRRWQELRTSVGWMPTDLADVIAVES